MQAILKESKYVMDLKEIDLPSCHREPFGSAFESEELDTTLYLSNPTAFNKCLHALALSDDKQTLSLYAHHSNIWRRELSIHLPKVLPVQDH